MEALKTFLPRPGLRLFFVGLKGTGMTALAQLYHARGLHIRGSDVPETFFTDQILQRLGLELQAGFDKPLPEDVDAVVYSAAYDPLVNPQLIEAARRGLPLVSYHQALGALSLEPFSVGIAGVHGKTTTTALCGVLARALKLPFSLIVGSVAPDLGESAAVNDGSDFLIAETCEYRRHFLSFHPDLIVLTSVEMDHQDYFKDLDDLDRAFLEYLHRLPPQGTLIYCADDPGARRVARRFLTERPDVCLVPYGTQAEGTWAVSGLGVQPGRLEFHLSGFYPDFHLSIPGRHNALNAAAALGVCSRLYETAHGQPLGSGEWEALKTALAGFRGTKRRSEVLSRSHDIVIMDDYGHHPTAIETTLRGLKEFYPGRRLLVSFMSHTYSRTQALLSEFAGAFGAADQVFLHEIYASARETRPEGFDGRALYEALRARHPQVHYYEKPLGALPALKQILKPGDIFLSLGAGDNWHLAQALKVWLEAHR